MFTKELSLIKNQDIRDFTESILKELPEYFFEIPASSTGKYHPAYAVCKGGLVQHTKAAVYIAYDLLYRNDLYKNLQEKADHILSALILHDGCKNGLQDSHYTKTEHPLIVSKLIKEKASNQKIAEYVTLLIETHMGQWNKDYKTGIVKLPTPVDETQNFVHLCDYLASRKFLEFNFSAV